MLNTFLHYFLSDIDECALNTDNCNSNANCTNTDGTYNCTCKKGYLGDGSNCTSKKISFILPEMLVQRKVIQQIITGHIPNRYLFVIFCSSFFLLDLYLFRLKLKVMQQCNYNYKFY